MNQEQGDRGRNRDRDNTRDSNKDRDRNKTEVTQEQRQRQAINDTLDLDERYPNEEKSSKNQGKCQSKESSLKLMIIA